jgi:uncharacterized protein (DUF486 family)
MCLQWSLAYHNSTIRNSHRPESRNWIRIEPIDWQGVGRARCGRIRNFAGPHGTSCHRGFPPMRPVWLTIGLLSLSNVFMTFAWYAHLKELQHKPWIVAALVSWGIALFEYLLQVPGNRIGYTVLNVGQLKILQEVITLTVFVPFAVLYLKEPLKLDYLWAALCILGAVYFVFRSKFAGA